MSFVVGPVRRMPDPSEPNTSRLAWPVVFEDLNRGTSGDPVAYQPTREASEQVAAELNAVLTKYEGK